MDSAYPIANTDELTIGDLHGNAIKLLYFLIKQQIINNINRKEYKKLVDIYNKSVDRLEKKNLDSFNKIVEKIECKNQKILVRLFHFENFAKIT